MKGLLDEPCLSPAHDINHWRGRRHNLSNRCWLDLNSSPTNSLRELSRLSHSTNSISAEQVLRANAISKARRYESGNASAAAKLDE